MEKFYMVLHGKKIITDERLVTDFDFFESLDLDIPGLEAVKNALHNREYDRAKKEVITYFHKRSDVQYLFDYRGIPLQKFPKDIIPYNFQASLGLSENIKDFCLYAADELMENRYIKPGDRKVVYDFGPKLENPPHFNFITDIVHTSRSAFSIFSRGQFFEYLMFKYHETGDSTVLKKYSELLEFFFENYPLQVQDTSSNAGHLQFDEDRDSMNVGWLLIVYTGLLYTEMTYQIDYKEAFEILKHIWFLGIQFRRFDTDTYRPYNHHFFERGIVPFFLATMFPEIPDFTGMYEKGKETIVAHIKEDYNTEGGYNEHSVGYWTGAALGEMLYRAVTLSNINNLELLDEDAQERITKTLNVFVMICPATEKAPTIGDKEGTLIDPFLNMAIRMTGNEWCKELLAVRQGSTGKAKLPLYYSNHHSGFTMARTGYAKDDTFALMSTKINCGISGHNHMDMLSLIYHVRGTSFIDEAYTGFLYSSISHKSKARGYLYNMDSHNTVLCYGKPIQEGQCYANRFGVYRPDSPVREYKTFEYGMYASAYHYGYTYCSHRRDITFADNGNMLVHDEVNRGNRLEEAHIQRWNLHPGVAFVQRDDNSLVLTKDGIKLLLVWDNPQNLKIFKNTEPLEGLFTEDQLGFTIDVSFVPKIDGAGLKEMMVPINMLAIDVTEKDAQETEVYLKSCSMMQQHVGKLEAINILKAL